MKISTKGQNALYAMLYMAVNYGYTAVKIKTISNDIAVSEKYLLQIFHLLKNAKLIDALRGTNGGYYINRQMNNITVEDILIAVEDTLIPVKCIEDAKNCLINFSAQCLTRKLWVKTYDAIKEVITNITLNDLIKEYIQL